MKTNLGLALLLIAFSAAFPGTANAAVIWACKLNSIGTIRIVAASTNCSTLETKISWESTGPQGPAGEIRTSVPDACV